MMVKINGSLFFVSSGTLPGVSHHIRNGKQLRPITHGS